MRIIDEEPEPDDCDRGDCSGGVFIGVLWSLVFVVFMLSCLAVAYLLVTK